jgi:uncharacterized protein
MNIYGSLLAQIPPKQFTIKQVIVGLHWTVVVSRFAGMASTLQMPKPHHEDFLLSSGKLIGEDASQIAQLILSQNLMEASLGLATINSLLPINPDCCEKVNAFEIIKEKGNNKKVAIIGHFPFVEKLSQFVGELYVFEKEPKFGDLAESKMPEILPDCDVIGISATSILNHSIENILRYSNPNAYKIMIGPSTPMTKMLYDFGFDLLAGTRILKPKTLIRFVSQGATYKQVQGVEVITMKKGKQ